MATRSDAANLREGSEPQGSALTAILQAGLLNFRVADGAAADTGIEVLDVEVGDEIVCALHFPIADVGDADAVTSVADITSEVTVTAADEIEVETTVTTGGKILVVFADLTGDDQ